MAIDGMVRRRTFDRASGKSLLHMVSAWGSEQRLVLAQVATDVKSNEITAAPKLLRMRAFDARKGDIKRCSQQANPRPYRADAGGNSLWVQTTFERQRTVAHVDRILFDFSSLGHST